MAERPGCHFTLVRFLLGSAISTASPSPADANDRRLDDTLIDEFRYYILGDESAL